MNDYGAIQLAMQLHRYMAKWLCIFTEGLKNKAYTWLWGYAAT